MTTRPGGISTATRQALRDWYRFNAGNPHPPPKPSRDNWLLGYNFETLWAEPRDCEGCGGTGSRVDLATSPVIVDCDTCCGSGRE